MPWTSDRQERWGNSPSGVKAMGASKVHEFNEATKGREMPEHHSRKAHHARKMAQALHAALIKGID